MKGKRAKWGIVGAVALVLIMVVMLIPPASKADDFGFLSKFRYTAEGDANIMEYSIYGDPAAIRAALPNFASAQLRANEAGVPQYAFFLPSGKAAYFDWPPRPGQPLVLEVDRKPTSVWLRILRRFHLA